MNGPGFNEVTWEEFKEVYFRLGGGPSSGWTADYWREVMEPYIGLGWRFMVEEPRSAEHNRMCVATDHESKEHRLFFMTDEQQAEL